MAITSLNALIPLGRIDNVAIDTATLDANGEKVGFMIQARSTEAIVAAAFRVTNYTTNSTLDCRLETIGSDGLPTGTLVTANANVSVNVTATGLYEAVFTASYTPAAIGELLWFVISQGTPGNITVAKDTASLYASITQNLPKTAFYSGGSWGDDNGLGYAAIKTSSGYGTYATLYTITAGATSTGNISTTTSPDEVGNKINFPFSCRVVGIDFYPNALSNTTFWAVKLYNSSGTELATASVTDVDYPYGITSSMVFSMLFSSPVTLAANTDYYITFLPGNATNSTLYYKGFGGITGLKSCYQFGDNTTYVSRTDAGAWTENSDRILMMFPVIDGLDFQLNTIS